MALFGRLFRGRRDGAGRRAPGAAGAKCAGKSPSAAEWEERAAAYLEEKGLTITARNVRMRLGEIDIVAADGDEIVFVEVKARRSREFGGPEYAISARKRARILKAAKEYLVRKRLTSRPCRFDAVLIYTGGSTPEFQHMKDAFGEPWR